MGLGNTNNATYVNVSGNKLAIKTDSNDPDAVSRKIEKGDRAGTVVYEKIYTFIEGYIKSFKLEKYESESFIAWNFKIQY